MIKQLKPNKQDNIIILEPDKVIAGQVQKYLNSLGYKTSWCKNAQEAINVADQNPPKLVIIELFLVAHSGMEFLYEFRSYNEWRNVPVIIFSRIPRSELPAPDKALKELGVDCFMYKPETSLKRLGEMVKALLPPKVKNEAI